MNPQLLIIKSINIEMNFKHYLIIAIGIITTMSCKEAIAPQNSNEQIINPQKELIMDGLKRPWSMAFLSDHEALLAEKDGDLLRIDLKSKTKTVIQGFPSDLADSLLIVESNYPTGTYPRGSDGFKGRYNAGIFEVLLDPEFNSNQTIYVSYVSEKDQKYATKVIKAKLVGNRLQNVQTLLLALPYADGLFHFGGGMILDEGKLIITVGERLFGDALQPAMPIAQDYEDTRGKIYRINTDGSIPIDNPGIADNAVKGIYATGIRAAQGLTKDPLTGKIWFTEHGTIQGDELNILEAGNNYGWPVKSTGGYRGGYEPPQLDRVFTNPKWSWYKTIAPTGLTFYSGHEFPQWKGNLIVPGLSRGNFWRIDIQNDEIVSVEELFINDRHRTRKAVQSPDGELYILTDEQDGKIIRIYNDHK